MTRTMQAMIGILSVMMLSRGVDYITGDSIDRSPIWVENLSQPEVWGIACIVLAVTGGYAVIARCPVAGKWVGFLGFAVNAMFAVQIWAPSMSPWPWPPEDTRLVTDHLGHAGGYAVMSLSLWWRMGVERRMQEKLEQEQLDGGAVTNG